ncbi:MAG: PP2C family protein-serine/threonine phosphatase, partial [Streptosporangiales bacterium]
AQETSPARTASRVSGRAERYGPAALVMALGLAITVTLFLVTSHGYQRGEQRLLALQTRLAAADIAAADPLYVEDHLGGAARMAAAGNGSAGAYALAMRGLAAAKGPFTSASLWRLTGGPPRLVASTGGRPLLSPASPRAAGFIRGAAASKTFVVTKITTAHAFRLGYAIAAAGPGGTFVAYTEEPLPAGHQLREPPSSPLSQLNLAIYLGRSPTRTGLLEADATGGLPLRGLTYTSRIPFGDTVLTLVASPRAALAGTVSQVLPWAILAGGLLLTAAAGLLTERVIRRRQGAEQRTGQVSELYLQQRSVAETLQHALLPQQMPEIPGMEIAARYLPAADDADIGGDWYEVVPLPGGRFIFLIGDVSGHGIRAATVMASLHYASRAYAVEGHHPAVILDRLRGLLDLPRDGHFATVACGLADVAAHQVTLANAGHLPPLICAGTDVSFAEMPPEPPVGIGGPAASSAMLIRVPPGGTLLCYTDGLVERRGEVLDVGLKRLAEAAAGARGSADRLLDDIVTQLTEDRPRDDIALMGLRWLT